MSYYQEVQSALTSDAMPNSNSQHFSLISNKQSMKTTLQPVSNNEVNPSSSGQNNLKLPSPFICTACKKSSPQKNINLHCDLCSILFFRNIISNWKLLN